MTAAYLCDGGHAQSADDCNHVFAVVRITEGADDSNIQDVCRDCFSRYLDNFFHTTPRIQFTVHPVGRT